jgi:hypothetical protein
MTLIERVVQAEPYGGPGAAHVTLSEDEVEELLQHLEAASGPWASRPADLKALTFLLYTVGQSERLMRLVSPAGEIEQEATKLLGALRPLDAREVEQISQATILGYLSHSFARDRAEGWATAVLDLLAWVAPQRIVDLVEHDKASLIPRYVVTHGLPLELWPTLTGTLLRRSDEPSRSAAFVLADWSFERRRRSQGDPTFDAILTAVDRSARIAILAKAVASCYRRLIQPLQEEIRQTESEAFDLIQAQLKKNVESAADVRAAVREGKYELLILAVLATFGLRQKATDEARQLGEKLYRDAFSPATEEDLPGAARRIDIVALPKAQSPPVRPYIAQESINLLKIVGQTVPLSADRFEELAQNLQCDDLARDLDYSLYLFDRRRAVLLAAFGALVGAATDATLHDRARGYAKSLTRLPSGTAVFSEEYRTQLSSETNIDLPLT